MSELVDVTLDFETYYDKKLFSLSLMPTQIYVEDPRFEVILFAIKVGDQPTQWVRSQDAAEYLAQIPWAKVRLIAHNVQFDGLILSRIFGHVAAEYVCTIALANTTRIVTQTGSRASLDKLSQYLTPHIPKGKEVVEFSGYRLRNFTAHDLQRYANYCVRDVDITYEIYKMLTPHVNRRERLWHDLVFRAQIVPKLVVDRQTILDELDEVDEREQREALGACEQLGYETPEVMATALRSADKFKALLESLGVEVQYKTTTTKAGKAPAFAKTDAFMQSLLESDDALARVAAQARLNEKGSMAKNRAEAFLPLSRLSAFGAPYLVSSAATHRVGGSNALNLQNLPSGRGGKSKALRRSLSAPEGHVLVGADSAQIEVRTLAWFVDDQEALQAFRDGKDPYLRQAAMTFKRTYDELKALKDAGDPSVDELRTVGKIQVLSFMYRAGPDSARRVAKLQYGVVWTEAEAEQYVAGYRNATPKVPRMWAQLDQVFRAMARARAAGQVITGALGGPDGRAVRFTSHYRLHGMDEAAIMLPDGNVMVYAGLVEEQTTMPWGDPGVGMFYQKTEKGRMVKTTTHGGKLLENINQALGMAVMKGAGVRAAEKGLYASMTTHDEFVWVVARGQEAQTMEIVSEVMTTPPVWAPTLPLGMDAHIGSNYGEIK